MPTQLYVANLSYTVTNSDLERLFAVYGAVHDARVMSYPDSGQSTGSAIVDMGCEEASAAAIVALDGREYLGRPLVVVGRAAGPAGSERETEAMISEGSPALAVSYA
jgi:cold-inducible RNA-binding protein